MIKNIVFDSGNYTVGSNGWEGALIEKTSDYN